MNVNDFNQQFSAKHLLIKELVQRYKKEGIELPFPHSSVIIEKMKSEE
jgi:small-conductance mechanosensitive channel